MAARKPDRKREPDDVLKEARRIGRLLRESIRERKREFSPQQYIAELTPLLQHLAGTSFDAFVLKVADDIDRESKSDQAPGQMLFHGFDLSGEYRPSENIRVAKRYATWEHANGAMLMDDENLKAVKKANTRKHKELEKLKPYWDKDGITKEQAVAAYQRANPEG